MTLYTSTLPIFHLNILNRFTLFCRLTSSSGNSMRFECLMSGTYLDTSVYTDGALAFEKYSDVYDNNYCLILEQAGGM